MKSRTLSCRKTAFIQDLRRFWPIGASYLLVWILLQISIAEDVSNDGYWYAKNLIGSIAVGGIFNLGYALVVAQAVFGDLYQTRMCNGTHSLPLRREDWFLAHCAAGLIYSLLPTACIVLLSEVLVGKLCVFQNGWQLPLYWWVGLNLQYLFFFGLAVLCTMAAGSRVGMLALYGIVNTVSLLLYLLVDRVYVPLLYGMVVTSTTFELLSPAFHILSLAFLHPTQIETGAVYLNENGALVQETINVFTVEGADWGYIGVLALIGLVLTGAALWLYRRRDLERAGDFLAFPRLTALFQVVFSLICATGCYAFYSLFLGTTKSAYPLLALGLVVGWFAGRMLLERTTQVFRKGNFVGLVLLIGAFALSLGITMADPLNLEGWLPVADKVRSAELSIGGVSNKVNITENIDDLICLHQIGLEEHNPAYDYTGLSEDGTVFARITYDMKDGRKIAREYYVDQGGEGGKILRRYGSRVEAVFGQHGITTAQQLRDRIQQANSIVLDFRITSQAAQTDAFRQKLADAILADCENGSTARSYDLHTQELFQDLPEGYRPRSLYLSLEGEHYAAMDVYADCTNTLKVLEDAGLLEMAKAYRQSQALG